MIRKELIIVWIIFQICLTISCQGQSDQVGLNLKDCINNELNKNIFQAYGKTKFDFYDFVLEFEKKLLETKLIKNSNQEEYFRFIIDINESKNLIYNDIYNYQNRIIDEYGFPAFSTETIFNQCPYEVSKNKKSHAERIIFQQSSLLYKLMSDGIYNKEVLTQLILDSKDSEFNKISYRAPIIILIMVYLDIKYSEEIDEFKN